MRRSGHGGAFNAQSSTATSDESNVTDAGLDEFPTVRGVPQVSTGRTGQTGGGEKPQVRRRCRLVLC